MRNPERIDKVIFALLELWHRYPDLRFGQLVEYITSKASFDMFYAEDDQWFKAIQEELGRADEELGVALHIGKMPKMPDAKELVELLRKIKRGE